MAEFFFTLLGISFVYCLAGSVISLKSLLLLKKTSKEVSKFPKISCIIAYGDIISQTQSRIESILGQDYPNIEIFLCINSKEEEWKLLVSKLSEKYSQYAIQLVNSVQNTGQNPKIRQISKALELATGDWLFLSDEDVFLDRHFFKKLMSEVDNQTGMISCPLKSTRVNSMYGHLENLAFMLFYSRAMYFLSSLNHPCVSSKCLFLRSNLIGQIGGLSEFSNYHADDVRLGRLIQQRSKLKVKMACFPVLVDARDKRRVLFSSRQVRWMKNRKALFWPSYFLELLVSPLFIFCFSFVMFEESVASFLILMIFLLIDGLYVLLSSKHDLKSLYFWPVWQLHYTYFWLQSLQNNIVIWNGIKYRIRKDGTMYLYDEE